MLDQLGRTQQDLLRLLIRHRDGMTVDALTRQLGVSRNAVYQHLAALERSGLVHRNSSTATGGRPGQTFALTDAGIHLFPKHYDWFAALALKTLFDQLGSEQTESALEKLGAELAAGLENRVPQADLKERTAVVADLMNELGYEARLASESDSAAPRDANEPSEIEAFNCIYHKLAEEHSEVCRLDIALIRNLLNADVSHETCMLRGSDACRFRVTSRHADKQAEGGDNGTGQIKN